MKPDPNVSRRKLIKTRSEKRPGRWQYQIAWERRCPTLNRGAGADLPEIAAPSSRPPTAPCNARARRRGEPRGRPARQSPARAARSGHAEAPHPETPSTRVAAPAVTALHPMTVRPADAAWSHGHGLPCPCRCRDLSRSGRPGAGFPPLRRHLVHPPRHPLEPAVMICRHDPRGARNARASGHHGSLFRSFACKTLVKQRLCASGMRWKNAGAKIVLACVPSPRPPDAGLNSGRALISSVPNAAAETLIKAALCRNNGCGPRSSIPHGHSTSC